MSPAVGPAGRKGYAHRAWAAETVRSKLNLHLLLKCNQRQRQSRQPFPLPPSAGQTCPIACPNDLRNAKYSTRNGIVAIPFLLTGPHPLPLSVLHWQRERGCTVTSQCFSTEKYRTPLCQHQARHQVQSGASWSTQYLFSCPRTPGASLGSRYLWTRSAQSRSCSTASKCPL